MKSFRDPKYVERYEDVIFDLETALNTTVANNAHQKKDGYRFVVDNSGEVTPFDWYNARRRAAYNKGFALRKALLGVSSTVNTEIPLNRYSFFEMLEEELLPNTRVEMNFEIESDGNLIWRAGASPGCNCMFHG